MKQRYAFLAFFAFLLFGVLYYVDQKKQTALFDEHIIDSIHFGGINAFFEEADAFKYAQNYPKARIAFDNLLPKASRVEDSIYIYNQLIYCVLAMNEDSLAAQYFREIDRCFPNIEKQDSREGGTSSLVLGDYFYNKGVFSYRIFHPKAAEMYLQKALIQYQNVYGERHLRTAMCLTELAMLNFEFVQEPTTISYYLFRAYDIYQSSNRLISFSAYNELGMALNSSYINRNYEIAQAHCENSFYLAQSLSFKNTLLMARAISYKGQMFKKKAEAITDIVSQKKLLDSAEIEFKTALCLFNKPAHPRMQELYRNNLILYTYTQDSIKFNQKLDTLKKLVANSHDYFAFEDRLKGSFYYFKGDSIELISHYKSFLNEHYQDSICNPALKDEAFWSLIKTYNKINLFDSTIYYITFWTTKDKEGRIDLDNYSKVQAQSTIYNHFEPLRQLGVAYFRKYEQQNHVSDLKKAVKAYCLADSFLFKRSNYEAGSTALTFQLEVGRDLYHNALKAVYALYDIKKDPQLLDLALLFCERMKSSILFRDIKIQANNERVKHLKQQLDKLIGQREVMAQSNYALSSVLTKTSKELDIELKKNNITDSVNISSIEHVKRKLNEKQAVIEYYSGQPTFALYISKEKILFHKIENVDSQLTKNLDTYRACLTDLNLSAAHEGEIAFSDAAFGLYNQLLKPFEPFLDQQKEIVIIPDKDLHAIPFEAFVTDQRWKGYKNAPYLIKKNYTLSYAPSWKIYRQSVASQTQSNYKTVCFSYGVGASDLVCSAKEINAISVILGENKVKSLANNECTKAHFMHEWQNGDYDILHISLHAKGNLKNIFDNKIWFSQDKKDFLYGFDLSGKQSNISLIVLAACETGLGNATAGEGAYSMSRYFFQAGAKRVLASLWKIDDCQSTAVITSFYKYLKLGQSPKQALCIAKRLFLSEAKDDLLCHPNLWAGTVCLE